MKIVFISSHKNKEKRNIRAARSFGPRSNNSDEQTHISSTPTSQVVTDDRPKQFGQLAIICSLRRSATITIPE